MYQPYVNIEEYMVFNNGESIEQKYLNQASRDIDVLTFNRIVHKGFSKLTKYQQDIIKEVCCEHASFLSENEHMLKTYVSS